MASRKSNIESIYKLSPLQQGILFHTLEAPNSGIYFQQMSYLLEGELDSRSFRRAWQQAVDRHAVLRTAFVWQGVKEPVQVVHRKLSVGVRRHDWRALGKVTPRQKLRTFLQEDRSRGFEVTQAPLMHLYLIRLGEKAHYFVWSHHHLLLDGWSAYLVLGEVFAYYEAFSSGLELELPTPPPYRDYIAWLQQRDLAAAERYWRHLLAGFTEPTRLGIERTATGEEGRGEGALRLPASTTEGLQSLTRGHGLTLNTLVQGMWGLLLSRYSGREDVVFGAITSGRPAELSGVERMVGLFINAQPVRTVARGHFRLVDWLRRLQGSQVEQRAYEHTPLIEIQSWSDVPRGQPLFESLLVFENYPVYGSESGAETRLAVLSVGFVEQTNYPLTLQVEPGRELALSLVYDRRQIEGDAAERLLGHLRNLLEASGAHPEDRLEELPLLGAAERHQIVAEWNHTAVEWPFDGCLHERIEEQVERTPEAVAVAADEGRLSYRELNRRANRLAHHLGALGVGPDVLVGLCAERSLDMVIGLLGILKAGGAYVPFDPSYPRERLAVQSADSRVAVLLTQRRFVELLTPAPSEVVLLDADPIPWMGRGDANPVAGASPESLAYAIYTSGSTGVPKGVMNRHRAIVNRLLWMQEAYRLEPGDRVLQKTPFSFDVSVWEFFWPLMSGAQLVMARPEGHRDGAYLVRRIGEERITTLHFVPSMLQLFVEEQGLAACRSLKRVIASGEALAFDLEQRCLERLGAPLFNLYGPTEAAVDVTHWTCGAAAVPRSVPIGRPIANTRIQVVDPTLHPLPVGVPGELLIGGVQLARGYLNRPGLTAEKFIPDPFGEWPGARRYKTGDLVRYRTDAEIDFLGRIDYQVKIRGFRIELGEIESALEQLPTVREAVVLARHGRSTPYLVAYVVPTSGDPIRDPSRELRRLLSSRLPDYMVPAAFIPLGELPLTPNGKIDRRALPALSEEEMPRDAPGAPRTPIEEILAAIWSDVLDLETVGVNDNFLELGGHSLLAIQVAARIRTAFGVEVPVGKLFAAPTIAGLAREVETLRYRQQGSTAPPLEPRPRREGVARSSAPLSFAQERLWILDQLEGGTSAYNLFFPLKLMGPLNVAALQASLDEIFRRHEALRTRFITREDRPIQWIEPEVGAVLPRVDLQRVSEAAREREVARIGRKLALDPFDLRQAPLLRSVLAELDSTHRLMFLTLHHIVSDGWSMEVLQREMEALYKAIQCGEPSPLAELPVQYADYAVWQRAWLQGEPLEAEVAYWRERLVDAPAVLDLPTDRPRPATQSTSGGSCPVSYPPELQEAVVAFAHRNGATLYMVLLAAFDLLITRYTGRQDVVVGSPVANRSRQEIEGLIGFFVNTVVLRTDTSGDPDFRELLARVRDTTLEAYAHQDLPFEKLVEELDPERSLAHSPIFQVMLVLQNVQRRESESSELTLSPRVMEIETTKFDLELSMVTGARGLGGALIYSRALFDEATIRRMLDHFGNVLRSVVRSPGERISELSILSLGERHQLLAEWNDSSAAFPEEALLHRIIARQAERSPDAIAVVSGEHQLSYRALDRRSGNLADHLRGRKVGPEVLVGICAERSLEMVVGLCGILKAGGAYVPLDPSYPKERLAFMMEDSRVPVILTQERFTEALETAVPELVLLDAEPSRWTGESEVSRDEDMSPDSLAYMIYTSGSTGRPKGAMNSHRAIVNRLRWMQDAYQLNPTDSVLQKTPFSFDVSVWEFFWPLLLGARLVMARPEGHRDSAYLVDAIAAESVTTLHFVPSMLEVFLEEQGLETCRQLTRVITSGEALSYDLEQRCLERLGAPLFNLYGPTEAAVDVTHWRCTSASEPRSVPIGRPVANTRIYVLDRALCPVAVGVPGELLIGGVQLARGYFDRPRLTAEKFIPDPYPTKPGSRGYKTGDLVRTRTDGAIEFLGRLDFQVKVRGFRIELGEIEATLEQSPAVREAVVLAREAAEGLRLVGYVVASGGDPVAKLREFLTARLPEYMVPATLVRLDKLPLTPNGKVDRAALRRQSLPARERSVLAVSEFVPPRTPREARLAVIWARMLGVERVGVHDNFFTLGGHSLLAIRLVSQIRREFEVDLPLRQLFRSPTVATLAELLESQVLEGAGALPEIVPAPEQRFEPFPLTDLQQAYWVGHTGMFDLGNASAHIYHELEISDLDLERFQLVWRKSIARHEMLRAIVRDDGRQQILAQAPLFEIAVEDVRGRSSEFVDSRLETLRQRMSLEGPPIAEWPLFEVRALRVDERRVRLLINFSLLISDAFSFELLLREMMILYEHPEASLEALDLSFRDYVLALEEMAKSAAYQRSLDYWRDRLATLPSAPELPLARGPSTIESPRFRRRRSRLEPSRWSRVRALAAAAGVTPTVVVAAVYAEVLAAWSKSRRFTMNLLFFNRLPLHPQIQSAVGNFSSTLLLEVDYTAAESFEHRARRLQEQLWRDIDHSYVTGVRVMRELHRSRSGASRSTMPVVLASTLNVEVGEKLDSSDPPASEPHGQWVYGCLQTPQVWLDHQVSEGADGALEFNWDAVEDLFPTGLIDEMFEAYRTRLRRLSEEDEAWQEVFPVLVPRSQLEIRTRVNATEAPVSGELLQNLFVARARQQRNQPAVVSDRRVLSYGELENLAAWLGQQLRDRGATPNTLVAVVMEKGWEQVAAVLGVLEAGAAYLPIDASLPRERLWYLLEHGRVRWVLTQPRWEERCQWPAGVERLVVSDRLLSEPPSTVVRDSVQTVTDLAYAIYTSGSTGKPKGVMIDHRGAVNTILDLLRRFEVGPLDRVLALSSLSFDLSVFDVFGLLAAGGAVVLPEASAAREPARWTELVRREKVTIWNSVPALMQMWVEYLSTRNESPPASLRLVLLSGDWIPVTLPDRIRALFPEVDVISLGGATEASIWSILHPVGEVDPSWPSIPYGRPMVNQQFHVLNEVLEPCPTWVPGQLYIAGIGLAQGYWRDEEKTRAAFVTHPRTGERLYRTGDLGRYLPEGDIEFLGREDFQVKVQGYRIELGEIEAALVEHPEVRTGVVSAVGERHGEKRLVGYFVPEGDEVPAVEELSGFLRRKLPGYMVPSTLISLPELPLSANGKVDRSALAELSSPARGLGESMSADDEVLQDGAARDLARIWEEILETGPVRVTDNFFELGGNSLLAVRLVARIRERFDRDLPLATLFESATIEDLARVLRRGGAASSQTSVLVAIQPEGSRPPFFCVHPVGGSVLCYAELSRCLGRSQPFLGLQVPGIEAEGVTKTADRLESMAARYIEALQEFKPEGPYRLGGWSMGGVVAFEMARQLRRQGEKVEALALIDAAVPGNGFAPDVDDSLLVSWFARDLGGLAGQELSIDSEELRKTAPEKHLQYVVERARAAAVLPGDVEPSQIGHHLEVFKKNYRLLLAYVPRTYPGHLDLIRPRETGSDARQKEPTLGWGEVASRGVEVHWVPGSHYSMVQPPHVEALAAALASCLGRVSSLQDSP